MASVIVTRDKVVGPPDRFLDVSDHDLVKFFQGVFSPQQEKEVSTLHNMLEGLCNHDFSSLKSGLEQGFSFFASAAAGKTPKEQPGSWKEVDSQELRFLSDLWEILQAGHYKFLGRQEWESALGEDFSDPKTAAEQLHLCLAPKHGTTTTAKDGLASLGIEWGSLTSKAGE
ncbi:hypothetical protein N2152v2_000329 [Parachlorella kessleri]